MDKEERVAALVGAGCGWHSGIEGLCRTHWLQAAASSSNTSPSTLTPCCESEPIINKENESDEDARKEGILLNIPV